MKPATREQREEWVNETACTDETYWPDRVLAMEAALQAVEAERDAAMRRCSVQRRQRARFSKPTDSIRVGTLKLASSAPALTAPPNLTDAILSFEISTNSDKEITCFACMYAKCEYMMTVPGDGRMQWYGLHERCYPIVKSRTPDLSQALSDARSALHRVYDHAQRRSDMQCAELARQGLAGTPTPVAAPDPVQAAYEECARLCDEKMAVAQEFATGDNDDVELHEHAVNTCRSLKREIEAAAARAKDGGE